MSTAAPITIDTGRPGVPLGRLVKLELRKMFDTRSGFWLMMSIAIVALIATVSVILVQALADDPDVSYETFSGAVGFPMAVILPVIAILSVTSEWSQRTGLITFTLTPHRGNVILSKAIAAVVVGVVSMIVAMAIGAIGNLIGSGITGEPLVWDVNAGDFVLILLGNVLGLLIGFMLGVLIRNSAAAIVAYFVYSFVLTTIFQVLAELMNWFDDLRPWIDFNFSSSQLFDAPVSGEEWAQMATSGIIWLVLPLLIGVRAVLKSEVK